MKISHMRSLISPAILAVVLAIPLSVSAADRGSGKSGKSIDYDAMVEVPAGKFIYGKLYAKKEVELPAFRIDKYEVTNEQYAKVNADFTYEHEDEHMPVVFVSQIEAEHYCKALGKRLPSEEEWEKAARGTDGRIYPWGDDFDEAAAVTAETAEGRAADVGSRAKGESPYGAMDMAGNVWEWTTGYDQPYAILRGGSFYEDSWASTVISTLHSIPDDGKDYVGFRCVQEIK